MWGAIVVEKERIIGAYEKSLFFNGFMKFYIAKICDCGIIIKDMLNTNSKL